MHSKQNTQKPTNDLRFQISPPPIMDEQGTPVGRADLENECGSQGSPIEAWLSSPAA